MKINGWGWKNEKDSIINSVVYWFSCCYSLSCFCKIEWGTVYVEEVNETNEDVGYFPGCDDDEKVIPLGDGFLGGEAYLQNGDEEIYLNSETDSSAITVKEAKEILKSRQAESDNQ